MRKRSDPSGQDQNTRIGTPVKVVDLSGLRCPALGRRVRKALSQAADGSFLDILCNDPLATVDIPHLAKRLGYRVVAITIDENRVKISIWEASLPNIASGNTCYASYRYV